MFEMAVNLKHAWP